MAMRTPRRSRKCRRVLRSSRNHEPSSPPPQSSPAHSSPRLGLSALRSPSEHFKRGKKLPTSSSDSRAAHANKLVDAPHRIASPSPPPPAASVPKPEAEMKKLKVVPTLASASSTSESTRPSSRRTAEFKRSLLLVVLAFTCIISVPYAVYLRQ